MPRLSIRVSNFKVLDNHKLDKLHFKLFETPTEREL